MESANAYIITPPSSVAELSPPLTPKQQAESEAYISDADLPPALNPDTDRRLNSLSPLNVRLISKTGPVDADIEDNYVQRTLANAKPKPPITWSTLLGEINYISTALIAGVPLITIYGAMTTELKWQTAIFSVLYYFFTGLGITAGYHRLWAHRAYNASTPLQYFLCLAGSGACEGSIKWWSRGHRAHHRYTDTELDPYNAHRGFWYSHVGWMLVKPRIKPGVADISDLIKNPVVRFQQKHYVKLLLTMGFIVPTVLPGLLWGDYRGGYFYAGAARLLFVHHSTFCVNSLAHWLGEQPFDDKNTPRNHFITALCTVGEGYHNFHHQFPMDFRNAIRWYQYDPTKWFISVCYAMGLASHLKMFPSNEIKKGEYTMELKRLERVGEEIKWPIDSNELPVISWTSFQEQAKERPLILIHGFIHDVSSFMDEHPGGKHLLSKQIGKDATTAFFGGVYDHSNAAHNLLAMMRVGVLDGGMEVEVLKIEEAQAKKKEQALAIVKDIENEDERRVAHEKAMQDVKRIEEEMQSALLRSPPEHIRNKKAQDYFPPSQQLHIRKAK
ncbi:hypothetical protein E3Q19_01461 [Wallemia mellicola]|nr:hypothetical protein E3Q19_01461 [Wallemia mellicola]